jgi:membrane-associated phospholipid phosphatase
MALEGRARIVLPAAAVFLFGLFTALGVFVSRHALGGLDRFALGWKGAFEPLALFFTGLGLWFSLLPIAAIVLFISFRARRNVALVVAWIVSQILSQSAIVVIKPFFHRLRPPGSLGYHPADYSYPSGHAATAIVFYAALAYIASVSTPRPSRAVLTAALFACSAGICWSRIALGAHYASDVIGGLLFGCAWLCCAAWWVTSRSTKAIAP